MSQKYWRVNAEVEAARGWQAWIVPADTAEEALQKFNNGDESVKFEGEEIEVEHSDKAEVIEEASAQDYEDCP